MEISVIKSIFVASIMLYENISLLLFRGGMVQKDEQYIFIHTTVFEYWKDLKSHSPSLSSILPAGIEDAQEATEDDTTNHSHFIW